MCPPTRHVAVSPLRAWRQQRGLTLQEIADLCGVSTAMLSLVERGQRGISVRAKIRIARCLQVRIADLFAPDPPRNGRDP